MAGYQGSETSGAEVTVYTRGNDPVLQQARGIVTFRGRRSADDDASLVSVQTSKGIGQAAGSWSFTVRPSRSTTFPDLRLLIADDDWVDIVLTRHGRRWHVMRGMVDEVRRVQMVGGNGATTTQYLITGRDFGRVFDGTPIWFNRFRGENVGGALGIRIFSGVNFTGTVANTVFGILQGFLAELGNLGRATWTPPPDVPNVLGGNFVDSVAFNRDDFLDDPPRFALAPQLMDPQGQGCWELAKEWSDPMFCELWCDLFDVSGERGAPAPFRDDREVPVERSFMGVVLRDIPYIDLVGGRESPWFRLPLYQVPREAVVDQDIGRGGFERYNAFFVGPQVHQDFGLSQQLDLTAPLWDRQDILDHGFRRFDINTHYVSVAANLLTLVERQRTRVRDWYCMNPYLYNGSLTLARGFPEIRIGSRVRIPGQRGESDQETYYVEQVGHTWAFGPGLKTSLGVTRGWIGSDDSYLDKLQRLVARYEDPVRSPPGDFTEAIDTGDLTA